MSDWKIIVPEATTNKVLNPSAESAGSFMASGGSVTRTTTHSAYGLYSYEIVTAADDQGAMFFLSPLANAIHYATMRVHGDLPPAWDWSLDHANWHIPTLIETIDGDWDLYGAQFPAVEANSSGSLYVYQDGGGAGSFWLDGIQVEEKSHWTTFCDGTQPGCEWETVKHASASMRSGQSRAGGRVRDLQDDYNLDIGGMMGIGTPPQSVRVDEYTILPGGELSSIKIHPRPFTLTGVIRGSSFSDLHSKRQTLISILAPNSYPEEDDAPQPVRLRYTGSAVQKQIAAHYEGGLETAMRAEDPCYWERVSLRFLADDPFWYEIIESAHELDSNDSTTVRYVAGRLKSTGQWDNMKPPAAVGGSPIVYAMAVGPDGKIYIGGGFTDFDNIPVADNIVVYDPQTNSYTSLGDGLNDTVYTLVFDANGILYAGGEFTNAGGDGDADRVAQIDPQASVPAWSNVGGGPGAGGGTASAITAIAVAQNGDLILGGAFTNWDGQANANYIVRWNGAAWFPLGTGLNSNVGENAMDIAPDGSVFVGGMFTTAGGITVNHIAKWDWSSWSALGTGVNSNVRAVRVDQNSGIVYIGGVFTTAGGITVNYIAKWDGIAWTDLAGGMNVVGGNGVLSIGIAPDGIVYASGLFSEAGGIALTDSIARWNGSSWAHLDINLPAFSSVWNVTIGNVDSVIPQNYDVWIGFNTTGTIYYGGSAIVTNDGTMEIYPIIVIERSGGTSAIIETVRNEMMDKELLFDYGLLDGEELTIDLRLTKRNVISDFFGSRFDAILANSDIGTFVLSPGSNNISSFVDTVGDPTVLVYMLWKDTYKSFD